MAKEKTQDIDLGIVRFEYGDAASPQRAVLTIETDKAYRGGIQSNAKVMWHGAQARSHMFGLGSDGGDFSTRVHITAGTVRATQKAIDVQHATVFTAARIAELIEAAKAHYADVVQAGIDGFKHTYQTEVSLTTEVQSNG